MWVKCGRRVTMGGGFNTFFTFHARHVDYHQINLSRQSEFQFNLLSGKAPGLWENVVVVGKDFLHSIEISS